MLIHDFRCCFSLLFFLTRSFALTSWKRDARFDDVLPQEANLESFIHVRSKIQCALHCKKQDNCKGFIFNQIDNHCLLASQVYFYSGTEPPLSGARYYRIRLTCPDDGRHMFYQPSSTCFQLSTKQLTWTSARDTCQMEGGRLAVLDTIEKKDALVHYLLVYRDANQQYHIGGHRPYERWNTTFPNGTQDFIWLNGQPVVVDAYFYPTEPDNSGGHENILAFDSDDRGLWAVLDAGTGDSYYMCEFALF